MKALTVILFAALSVFSQITIAPDFQYRDTAWAISHYDSLHPIVIKNHNSSQITLLDIQSSDTFGSWMQLDSIVPCPHDNLIYIGKNPVYSSILLRPISIAAGDSMYIARLYVQNYEPNMCGDCTICVYSYKQTDHKMLFIFDNNDTLTLSITGYAVWRGHRTMVQNEESRTLHSSPHDYIQEKAYFMLNGKCIQIGHKNHFLKNDCKPELQIPISDR